mmetsp:Transcript_5697/g.6389  ORF Transcript_5697/g.6389 Transcript_5697/m.6389 type:complete len:470 (-) Transcript_5697:141-1550(-)
MKEPKSFSLDKINVSFLDQSKKTLPLVISPRYDDALDFICEWLDHNRAWVEDQMLQYGAVFIRGFRIESASDFERATLAVQPNLCDQYRGTSPRRLMENTKYAFSAAEVPTNYPIAQHLEMSFLKAPPRNLYFCCLQESKAVGGETSLCDFRKVYQDLSPSLRDKFVTKKIKYKRKHSKVGEKFTYDAGAMKTWIELFDTSEKTKVEEICQEEDAPMVQWVGPNKDTFMQEWMDDPCMLHPVTNEPVWFNHSQVFHWTTFPSELWYAFCRVRDIHLLFHFLFVSIFSIIKYGLLGYKMALDTTFGDGTPITYHEMNEIRDTIHKNMVFSRWRKGDILCIDNFSTSHGRQPTYDKGRKVIVAWSHPHNKYSRLAQNPISGDTHSELQKSTSENDDILPDLLSVSPDSSPESTLTEVEASELKNSFFGVQNEANLKDKLLNMEDKKKKYHKRYASCPSLLSPESEFWKKNQ